MNYKNAMPSLPTIGRATWRVVLLLVWATWWGGLCFYAAVVVPIGTELMGSVEQGFVTQRVTQWHNAVSILMLICILVEAISRGSRGFWVIFALLTINTAALILWHAKLTQQLDFEQQLVSDRFYSDHASYLWLTTSEWFIGIAVSVWLTRGHLASHD